MWIVGHPYQYLLLVFTTAMEQPMVLQDIHALKMDGTYGMIQHPSVGLTPHLNSQAMLLQLEIMPIRHRVFPLLLLELVTQPLSQLQLIMVLPQGQCVQL